MTGFSPEPERDLVNADARLALNLILFSSPETNAPIPRSDPRAVHLLEVLRRREGDTFDAGLIDEIRALLASGVPPTARPFGGLVYRQAMEYLNGVRSEAATRALIAQENRKYARRQLIWFRKEPNLVWFDGPGTNAEVQDSVFRELAARDLLKDGRHGHT